MYDEWASLAAASSRPACGSARCCVGTWPAGGLVRLSVAAPVSVTLDDAVGPQPLDLARKSERLLAENAAFVPARHHDDADIENLG